MPLAPEEHFAARGTPGAVEEEDGDDDDDGEDDEPHSHTTTRTSLEQMMVMMMMMIMMMNKKKTVSFPWRVVFLMPCWGELPEPRADSLARAASLGRSLNRRRLRSVAGCGLEARNDATALRAPATNRRGLCCPKREPQYSCSCS